MKKRPTIAQVLHLAADKYLETDREDQDWLIAQTFSCCAVERAARELFSKYYDEEYFAGETSLYYKSYLKFSMPIMQGLSNMGLETHSTTQFSEFNYSSDRQGARYAWLKFAAMIAEEQGV